MKKLTLLFITGTALLGLNSAAFAKSISTLNGSSHLEKGEYDSLKVNGNLVFKDLVIKGSIVTNGHIQGENLICKTMNSNGSVSLDGLQAQSIESNGSFSGQNIDISGKSEFKGEVEIKNGKLHEMQIATPHPKLIDTQVNGTIHMKKVNRGWSFFGFKFNTASPQILELKGKSLVKGDIIFEEEGEVHLSDQARVMGQIRGGKIVQK